MSARDLDAAGIVDPDLRASYELCRQLNAKHGKTYYLATLLLPPAKRPYVHALYGFARYADEIGLDLVRFEADLDAGSIARRVKREIFDARYRERGLRGVLLPKGYWHLDGECALAYARIRKAAGTDDFNRGGRQHGVPRRPVNSHKRHKGS